MLPTELIRKKRDGGELSTDEITALIEASSDGTFSDEQLSAFFMAVYFRGMTERETSDFTLAMLQSGGQVTWEHLDGPTADKHSTGGVGDKISLPLAPVVAACGVYVPMMAGRGLGHTGGTLDKLESIQGYRTGLSVAEFRAAVAGVGCAIVGQTAEIAPADRRFYALRDTTSTVESLPLIVSSIMSKKLAEGAGSLVLDVKCGSGAFMTDQRDAEELAAAMTAVGRSAGRSMRALVTDMSQVLGSAVGNALEVSESIDVLRGEGPPDVRALTIRLAMEMIALAEKSEVDASLRERVERALASGAALERFRAMVLEQGGDPRTIDDPSRLPSVPDVVEVRAPRGGYVTEIDTRAVGLAALELGAGRRKTGDTIDHAVGLEVWARVGDRVDEGQVLANVRHRDGKGLESAVERILRAFVLGDETLERPPLIYVTL